MLAMMLEVRGTRVVVIGAGKVGLRKAEAVLKAGAFVVLVDPKPEISAMRFVYVHEEYREEHLHGFQLVIAAVSREINERIVADAKRLGILVCDTSLPTRGNFIFPAVHTVGDLTIAVSTGGISPGFAKAIRDELAEDYDEDYSTFLHLLREMRAAVHEKYPSSADRKAACNQLGTYEWFEQFQKRGKDATRSEMLDWLRRN